MSDLFVSFKFGSHKYDRLPFLSAVQKITTYTRAEQEACEKLTKHTWGDAGSGWFDGQWVAGFWSEVLGGVDPPKYSDWLKPISRLRSAKSAYDANHNDLAIRHLNESVVLYNKVHKKWNAYRNALQRGGESAISIIEITNIVLGAGISGSAAVASKSVMVGAGASAGLTFVEQTSLGLGKIAYGLEDRLDPADIALKTTGSFVGSLIAGKLGDLFIGKIAQRLTIGKYLGFGTFKEVKAAAEAKGLLLPAASELQKFFIGGTLGFGSETVKSALLSAAAKHKGKNLSMDKFVEKVVDELPRNKVEALQNEVKRRYSTSKAGKR